jgi:superfamily II RNA helicase
MSPSPPAPDSPTPITTEPATAPAPAAAPKEETTATQPPEAVATEPRLSARLPDSPLHDPDEILDRFLQWTQKKDLVLYPAQEDALLQLTTGQHVILSTPTGSGKSLVALALHFKARCERKRSFYTAPTKALVSEKFFEWCDQFGPQNVGMLTGDASINREAEIICCTAEVLSNMAISEGSAIDAPYIVMDEFHYFGDPSRGMAWQIPLLELQSCQFLLMSATLGNTQLIEGLINRNSPQAVVRIHGDERPVPLDFSYRESPAHKTVENLLARNMAPIYMVHFTQREAAEQAQSLTSANICDKAEKKKIADALIGFRFDTHYGKDIQRFLRHGIGIHHAGLLPKYRLLVERIAQQGLLKIICGTDTLGVGVNIPIRTVLLSKLCKYDGTKVGVLSVRDFLQVSGRAGRRGFDSAGSVVCQAPEHVIENKRLEAKAATASPKKKKKLVKKKAPTKGYAAWDEQTLLRLSTSMPEPLVSRFRMSAGLLIGCLQSSANGRSSSPGYGRVIELIDASLEDAPNKRRLKREVAVLFRALRGAEIISLEKDPERQGSLVRVSEDLQTNFSLHHMLSLYLVEALEALHSEGEARALDILGLAESILENPRALLIAQERRVKSELMAQLKADGVPFEERIEKLDQVTWPKPNAEFIYTTFNQFADKHPWIGQENIRPKAIAREMFESYSAFNDYVGLNKMAPIEGVLLRYLSQVYTTLVRTIPDSHKTDAVLEIIAYFETLLARVDASLLEEWQQRMHPGGPMPNGDEAPGSAVPTFDSKAFERRVRAELHHLVRCLSDRNYAGAETCVHEDCVHEDGADPWNAARFEAELAPFYEEFEAILFQPSARQAHLAHVTKTGPNRYEAHQVLCDDQGENMYCIEAVVHAEEPLPDTPLLRLRRIGT